MQKTKISGVSNKMKEDMNVSIYVRFWPGLTCSEQKTHLGTFTDALNYEVSLCHIKAEEFHQPWLELIYRKFLC